MSNPATVQVLRALSDHSGDGPLREAISDVDPILQNLTFARQFVPYVLAKGVLAEHDHGAIDIIDVIVEQRFERDALLAKITELLMPVGDVHLTDKVQDKAFAFLRAGGQAGYLLGLAVGQQLGPGAFAVQGGDR
jgi:hypothetical protein